MNNTYTEAEALEKLRAELEAGEKSGDPIDEEKVYQMLGLKHE